MNKKVIGNLTKCYSICPLTYRGKGHILVAAEKQDPCYLFDLDGKRKYGMGGAVRRDDNGADAGRGRSVPGDS